ncbi:MAG: ribonuclease P protein component [Minisyncoccales bacterium]
MLARHYRLQKRKDIILVFKKGKTFKYQQLILKTRNNQLNNHRFTVIVSKKISKKAVVRNKIKRQLMELTRLKLNSLKNKPNQFKDNLLIALPGIEKKEFAEKKKIIDKLFKIAKL